MAACADPQIRNALPLRSTIASVGLECPDLHVMSKQVTCSYAVVSAKVDIRTFVVPRNQHKAWEAFVTRVTLDGQPLSPTPRDPAADVGSQHTRKRKLSMERRRARTRSSHRGFDRRGVLQTGTADGDARAENDNTTMMRITVPEGC